MKNSKLLGGTLLITGTTIGAAMLALPISTGLGGFFPAIGIFAACWLMMLWSAYLFLEVNLSLVGEVNLISMARATLGNAGASVAWLGFLLLLYSLLAAYMTGSGPLFIEGIYDITGIALPTWCNPLPVLVLFGPFVYVGISSVDYINRYLMIGLVVAFAVMVFLLSRHVDVQMLGHTDFDYVLVSFSVVITSFGYHIIIPSLTAYFDRDVKKIKACIMWGSLIPFFVYVLWEMLILGAIPVSGNNGIAHMIQEDISLSASLQFVLGNRFISLATRLFAVFAIVTSFLGVAQSLFDFLRDGVRAKNTHAGRALVWVLTFGPPLLFVAVFQKGFIAVLEYAGLFVAVLIGIVPILMTWSARYIKKLDTPYRVRGGRLALSLGLLFYAGIVVLVIATHAGWIGMNTAKYL